MNSIIPHEIAGLLIEKFNAHMLYLFATPHL
jgi:hypothetical protein